MGDRCGITINVPSVQMDKFNEITGEGLLSTSKHILTEIYLDEVNYGYDQELDTLALAGVDFEGYHTAGDDYSAAAFVSLEGDMQTVPIFDGDFIARVTIDPASQMVLTNGEDAQNLIRYTELLAGFNTKYRPPTQPLPTEDWQYAVANGDTILGLKEWREHNA